MLIRTYTRRLPPQPREGIPQLERITQQQGAIRIYSTSSISIWQLSTLTIRHHIRPEKQAIETQVTYPFRPESTDPFFQDLAAYYPGSSGNERRLK